MNIRSAWRTTAVLVLAAGVSLSADQIRLRSGKIVKGIFIGGDSKTVRVLLDNGQVAEVPLGDAVAVEFTPRKPAPPPSPPNPAAAPKPVTVPAGTTVNVRLTQAIDVDASQAGMKFKADRGRPGHAGGLHRDPARRGGGPASRPRAAVGQDEGQRQDLPEAALDRVWRPRRTRWSVPTSRPRARERARRPREKSAVAPASARLSAGSPAAAKGRRSARPSAGSTGAAVAGGGEEHLKLPAETRLPFQLSAAVNIQP